MRRRIELIMGVAFIAAAFFLAREGAAAVSSAQAKQKVCIVIDAGHGGDDPGKVGINGVLEKDLNLAIAKKLKALLEKKQYRVVMTREKDEGLNDSSTENKKVQDMRRRCEVITKEAPVFTVSIHQNSYPEEYVKGAQCFYFGQSEAGRQLAETLQESLRDGLDPENKRQAKANESYYLLKKTPSPTVIVECGFLSNGEEAALLMTEEYQNKVAKAVCEGITHYMDGEEKSIRQAEE